MTHAIRFHKTGGPEVLQWEEVEVGKPGPGEARVRNTAVGLNISTPISGPAFIRRRCRAGSARRGRGSSRRSVPASWT